MICGVLEKKRSGRLTSQLVHRMLGHEKLQGRVKAVVSGPIAFGSLNSDLQPEDADNYESVNGSPGTLCAVWQGEIYNRSQLLQTLDLQPETGREMSSQEIFLKLYERYGYACVEKINGSFAFAMYDAACQKVVLGRDRLGLETLYYYEDANVFVFSNRISAILGHPDVLKQLNLEALQRFLVFNYNPAWDTFFCGIKKVRPGHLVTLSQRGVDQQPYWFLSFREYKTKTIEEYGHDLRELIKDSITLREQDPNTLGIFLSGGLDSSSVAWMTRQTSDRPLHTFSYRCLGKSFDESEYARLMARRCHTEHHEIIYNPADICQMASLVNLMDEPLCNVGLIIATCLLGQAAQGTVSRIFTGDGGDELFGGHPVYSADKIAALFEKIPFPFRNSLTRFLRKLPDSDQKLNLPVKLKRFSESVGYPGTLGTNRWRIYYDHHQLGQLLLHPDISVSNNGSDPLFADIIHLSQEADGSDLLSRSLYVDFQTELNFSLRRMDLIRHFKLTPCFPLLDHRLVEYAATIPSALKLRGLSSLKYIQHRAMAGLLPDEIVYRKGKLGHSIPFKNWLRTEPVVKQFIQDILSEQNLKKRGLVNHRYVKELWENHQNLQQNNSHRLWTLTVLELWLSAHNL